MTPGWASVGVVGVVILILMALLSLLGGCVHVAYEPTLDFPERPAIKFFRCGPEEVWACLTPGDAELLMKYIQKLNEFDAARERLLKP